MKPFTGYQRGVNLGGWLSQCEHSEAHYDSFLAEADIARIAGWGLDHVRLPIDYCLLRNEADDAILSHGYDYIDQCLAWCGTYKLNLILDLHKTAGFSFDEDGDDFFHSKSLQDRFVSLWEDLAKRYSKYGDRIVFELLNEAVDPAIADIWNGIIKRTIAAIRPFAPTTKILVGSVRNNSVFWVRKLDAPFDENVVYTFHFYEPLIFTHQTAYWVNKMPADYAIEYPGTFADYHADTKRFLPDNHLEIYEKLQADPTDAHFVRLAFADAIAVAKQRDVPLYCGEYGVINKTSLESALRWFAELHDLFTENHIGRAVWNYKGKDFGLIDEHFSSILDQLLPLL